MLGELLAHDEVTETCVLRSRVGFMALHGGIEEGTAELARAASDSANGSLYTVTVGERLWWHVPSTRFDPRQSEYLRGFVEHVDVVFSLHGYGRKKLGATALLGGSNRPVARALAAELEAIEGLAVIADIEQIPAGLRGLHPRNPVNLPLAGGVQVELPPAARHGELGGRVVDALVATAGALSVRYPRCCGG